VIVNVVVDATVVVDGDVVADVRVDVAALAQSRQIGDKTGTARFSRMD